MSITDHSSEDTDDFENSDEDDMQNTEAVSNRGLNSIILENFIDSESSTDFEVKNYKISNTQQIIDWKKLIHTLNGNIHLNSYIIFSKKSFTSTSSLQKFLKSAPVTSKVELLWVIYLWITHNIKFDVEKLNYSKYSEKKIGKYLKKGKVNGLGFCMLFKLLCNLNEIDCRLITGYGKGYGYKVMKNFETYNHVWVAVNVEKEWQLIDVAWGAGYCRGGGELEFIQEFQPYYFFTPPEIFIYQHYCETFQLQENKITLEEYVKMPLLRLEYFLYRIEFSQPNQAIVLEKNPTVLTFKAHKSIQISADLYERSGRIIDNSVFTQKNYLTDEHEVNIQIPRVNQYWLRIYASENEKDKFKWIADFAIKTKINPRHLNFFQWCQIFTIPNRQFYLITPKKLLFIGDETIEYKIYVFNAKNVALIDEFGNLKSLNRDKNEKDIWYLKYTNNAKGDLKLSAKFEDNKPYYTCFSYIFI